MSDFKIFNRQHLKLHRNRTAAKLHESDFLFHEVAKRMSEQFGYSIVKNFPKVLELGSRNGILHRYLNKAIGDEIYVAADISEKLIKLNGQSKKIVMDDEFLPFRNNIFDLVISNLNLHTVNDLPGCLAQIKRSLAKGGMFYASFFGIQTLNEVKQILAETELELYGSVSPRIFPFIDSQTGASLLQRTKFAEPVTINEVIKVEYDNIFEFFSDIKNMGETNILIKSSKRILSRNFLEALNRKFLTHNQPVTFEIVYLSGWNL